MLKQLKRGVLGAAKKGGLFAAVSGSGWRGRRLAILCYHGISLADEHEWDPYLYIPPAEFAGRMDLLRREGYVVLALDSALERLYSGTLPERSVALTFDDGGHDFYRQAWPLLQRYGYPATVYLTTHYCNSGRPIFRLICSYILWKQRRRRLATGWIAGLSGTVELEEGAARGRVLDAVVGMAEERQLPSGEKDELARRLASEAGLDYDELLASRILQLMRPEEVAAAAGGGVDIQLHTHRHRMPRSPDLFRREIDENRVCIERMTGRRAAHFCYPSGVYGGEFLGWLKEAGVVSATTCEPGLATSRTHPLMLPRMVDHSRFSPAEFESLVTGLAMAIPRRRRRYGGTASG